MKSEYQIPSAPMPNDSSSSEAIDMVAVSRVLLGIVARWQEKQYTDNQIHQTAEIEDDGLNSPASETSTSQG